MFSHAIELESFAETGNVSSSNCIVKSCTENSRGDHLVEGIEVLGEQTLGRQKRDELLWAHDGVVEGIDAGRSAPRACMAIAFTKHLG